MKAKAPGWLLIVLALAGAWLLFGGKLPALPSLVTTKATAVTYVFEKDEHAVPSPVQVALDKLNRKGIVATLFEQDTVDGTGETPDQYKVPLAAAKEAGLPALVVTAGDKVLRTVKAPTTEAAVMEAAQ